MWSRNIRYRRSFKHHGMLRCPLSSLLNALSLQYLTGNLFPRGFHLFSCFFFLFLKEPEFVCFNSGTIRKLLFFEIHSRIRRECNSLFIVKCQFFKFDFFFLSLALKTL